MLTYWEHYNDVLKPEHQKYFDGLVYQYSFDKPRGKTSCFYINKENDYYYLQTSYCIGVDWLKENETAIYIEPKLNRKIENNSNEVELVEINYLKMLFEAFPNFKNENDLNELFQIKWDKKEILISQKQDLLTPLLVIQYLNLLKLIVKKGLKNSYYSVEKNLNSKIKGKVLVGQTVKQNRLKNKFLYTQCKYEEFGVDGIENRILKKALVFIKRYLPQFKGLEVDSKTYDLFNFITPAFENVSNDISLNEISKIKTNAFYKEYEEAIRIAKLILNRFGFNINNTEKEFILTPPFWIDMSKLFEYYVLSLLKRQFPKHNDVRFQFLGNRGHELDFLLNTDKYKMVVDTKYKPKYKIDNYIDKDDFRQLSGYARLKRVYDTLNIDYEKIISCLIIYPDLDITENNLNKLKELPIKQDYIGFYKIGVTLPIINRK